MAEPEQVLGRLDRARHVRGGDEREVAVERVALVRDHEREATLLQLQEVLGRLVGSTRIAPSIFRSSSWLTG